MDCSGQFTLHDACEKLKIENEKTLFLDQWDYFFKTFSKILYWHIFQYELKTKFHLMKFAEKKSDVDQKYFIDGHTNNPILIKLLQTF